MKDNDPLELTFHEYVGKPEENIMAAITTFLKEAKEHGESPPFTDRTIVEAFSDGNVADSPTTIILAALTKTTAEAAGLLIIVMPTKKNASATAEIAVRTPYRRRKVAQRLLDFMKDRRLPDKFLPHPSNNVLGSVKFWAHANSAAAQKLAQRNGFTPLRRVWKMRLPDLKRFEPEPLPGIRIRTFIVGRDERAWLEVNSEAFSAHPEQGSVSLEELNAYERENWFDPKGFFLAVGSNGRLLGFIWTKITDGDGEVYVLGVSPSAQGRGLGKFLLRYGINYLISQGLHEVVLHVDQSNANAIKLYEQNGFSLSGSDVLYG